MKESRSIFTTIRGMKYHVRSWGDEAAPKLFLVHGWQDNSASFQFFVDALRHPWHVLAPDWRGSGLSQWAESGSYWFSDFLADLSRLVDEFQPDSPVNLLGHSMGFNVASIFAGVRPHRVRRLINVECHGFRVTRPDDVRLRYAEWLEKLPERPPVRSYASFEELEAQVRKGNPRLSAERVAFIARHMAKPGPDGRIVLLTDPGQKSPANKMIYLGLMRNEEAMACWRHVSAPVLWIHGAASDTSEVIGTSAEEVAARKACFRDLEEVLMPGSGHMIHQEVPEELAPAVEQFLLAERPAVDK